MLEYEPWGNPSQMILADSDDVQPTAVSDPHGVEIFNANNTNTAEHGGHHSALSLDYAHAHAHHHSTFNNNTFSQHHHHFFSHQQTDHHTSNLHPLHDPRTFQTSYAPHNPFDTTGLNPNSGSAAAGASYFLVPKAEDGVGRQVTRIGLNLGHRTYFSAQDDDFVTRLYRRSRPGGFEGVGSVNSPRCQAEGCAADLSNAKHYHRRHKVCEFHSKAATVVAGGLTQRFCQQCSRS